MRSRKLISTKGISILEVLIAMLILSVALLMLLNMAMVALDGNDWSNKTTLATQLVQQKLEEIRATGTLTNGSDVVNNVTRSWTVSNAGPHLRNVSIAMSWYDVADKQHFDTMSTIIRTDSV